jgi:hypothetical protein
MRVGKGLPAPGASTTPSGSEVRCVPVSVGYPGARLEDPDQHSTNKGTFVTSVTRGIGAALIIVGVGAWLLAGGIGTSPTALLPALLGFLGTLSRALAVFTRPGDTGLAGWASLITALLCLIYVASGVRWFIAARRSRESTAS